MPKYKILLNLSHRQLGEEEEGGEVVVVVVGEAEEEEEEGKGEEKETDMMEIMGRGRGEKLTPSWASRAERGRGREAGGEEERRNRGERRAS